MLDSDWFANIAKKKTKNSDADQWQRTFSERGRNLRYHVILRHDNVLDRKLGFLYSVDTLFCLIKYHIKARRKQISSETEETTCLWGENQDCIKYDEETQAVVFCDNYSQIYSNNSLHKGEFPDN